MIQNTIPRTVAKEILAIFFVSLFAITLLVMFIGVLREAVNEGLSLESTFRLLPYSAPNAFAIAIPGTVLFSVCCVFGRMSASNEISSLQSVGISPLVVIRPAVQIAIVMSVVTVGLVNVAFTWGHHGVQRVVLSSVEQIAYRVLERDLSYQRGDISLSVLGVDGDRLLNPMITLRNNESEPTKIEAAEATLKYSVKDDTLTLRLTNGNASVGGQASFRFPDTFVHTVSLMKGHEYDLLTANPSHMPMSDLHPATMKQTTEIRKLQSAVAVNAGLNVLTSRFDSIASPSAGNRIARATQGSQRLHRLMAESNRRWASGFTCLALAMVGIPLAIHLKTADVMTTFGIVFLPTLIIYYPIFALTLDMAKDGRLPPWAVWSANGVFLGIGAIMMRKTVHL